VLSPLSARKAEKLGYKNVKVFHAGLPAWKKAGNLIVSNTKNLEHLNKLDASYVLLDLRSPDAIKKGHIPKAVEAPDGDVESLKDQFPKYKKAVIILYNQDGDVAAAEKAFKTITGWGFKQVSILIGGLQAWEKAGKKLATGEAAKEIKYVKKLLPGEMEIAAFSEVLKSPKEGFVIVDVRNPNEFEAGKFPNAVNIPLEEMEGKLETLPKDKTLLLHCNTGARAEMAYNVLKKAGFKVKYVKGQITFDPEKKGEYTLTD
jgi:rhodanese-related sulfurtransferase